MKYVVAAVDEIPPGGRKIVDVAGRSIGVFNLGGEYFALRNRCPHQGGPLCEGRVWGTWETASRSRPRQTSTIEPEMTVGQSLGRNPEINRPSPIRDDDIAWRSTPP